LHGGSLEIMLKVSLIPTTKLYTLERRDRRSGSCNRPESSRFVEKYLIDISNSL